MYAIRSYYAEVRRAVTAAQKVQAQEEAAKARLANSVAASGTRNWKFLAAGSTDLQPSEVYDNGEMTVLTFARQTRLPAIYLVGTDGEERLANSYNFV